MLGYATLGLGELERSERAYKALTDEYGLLPGDPLAPVRRELETSGFSQAPLMLRILQPEAVDRRAAEAAWTALGKELQAVVRAGLPGKPATVTGSWLDVAYAEQAISLSAPVPSLAPLARLPRLEALSIAAGLTALPFHELGLLTQLKRLDIGACGLEDVGFLRGLRQLERLILYENTGITDLSSLSGAPRLAFLQLGEGPVRSLEFLRGMSQLSWLIISVADEVTDYSPFLELERLEHLDLVSNTVGNLAFLAKARGLDWVTLRGRGGPLRALESLDGLENKPRLRWVEVSEAPSLRSVSALRGAAELKTLALTGAPMVTDFSALSTLPSLERLDLARAVGLTQLEALGPKPKLTRLDISKTGVTDLSPAGRFTSLVELQFYEPVNGPTRGSAAVLGVERLLVSPDRFVEPERAAVRAKVRRQRHD